jgi:hypothetical protein
LTSVRPLESRPDLPGAGVSHSILTTRPLAITLAASNVPLSTPLVASVTSVSMPPPMTYLAARLPSSLVSFLVALGVNTMPLGVLDSSLTSLLPRMFEPPAQSFVSRSVQDLPISLNTTGLGI